MKCARLFLGVCLKLVNVFSGPTGQADFDCLLSLHERSPTPIHLEHVGDTSNRNPSAIKAMGGTSPSLMTSNFSGAVDHILATNASRRGSRSLTLCTF